MSILVCANKWRFYDVITYSDSSMFACVCDLITTLALQVFPPFTSLSEKMTNSMVC